MLLTLCLILSCSSPDSLGIYSGRARQLEVRIPRVEADIVVDGDLGDSVWAHAALLTGFSQYAPNDGVSAVDSTQVLVWYSSNAIYFGIRAYELHGRPSATLADRDQIFGDDNVQILLGTFHDGKKALMLAPSTSAPSPCTPSGFTANINAFLPSWNVPSRICTLSSPKI